MNYSWKPRAGGIVVVVVCTALGVMARQVPGAGAGQATHTTREAEGARVLKGAIDMHFHMDPLTPTGRAAQPDIAQVRIARGRGLRGLVLKDHNETTAGLAYHLRLEIPNFELYGGTVMNLANGGIDVPMVEFMATQIKGNPGRVVWLPAGDTEAEVKASSEPNRTFVPVVKAGRLLPEVEALIAVIARHNLILASGHILAPEALMVFTEAKRQGVQHMIATHAMDLSGKMTIPQMQEAAKLGAIVEFDYRNIFDDNAKRVDAIKAVGPEHCLISEFWTRNDPREYGEFNAVGEWVEKMKAKGFTDQDLDLMLKVNPARLLGL